MIRQIVPLFFTMDIPATRRTADARPGKYPDELLDAHVFIADADALYAEYSAPGVEFTRAPATMPWGSRELVVKDCDGRLLTFGSNL